MSAPETLRLCVTHNCVLRPGEIHCTYKKLYGNPHDYCRARWYVIRGTKPSGGQGNYPPETVERVAWAIAKFAVRNGMGKGDVVIRLTDAVLEALKEPA